MFDWLAEQLGMVVLGLVLLLSLIPSSTYKNGAKWGFSELLKALFR